MRKTRTGWIVLTLVIMTAAFASDAPAQAGSILPIPKVGLRVGAGSWHNTMVGAGLDVYFKVPVVPLPGFRFDAEAWDRPDSWGTNRGHALSILGVQSFPIVYVGLGPSYYFTSEHGDHNSGLGLKLLAGANLPRNLYIEASTIVGHSTSPVMLWLGMRF